MIQSGLAVCGENFSTNHGCTTTNAAGQDLPPVRNHKLASISSDELASCVIMEWSVSCIDHQEQPVNHARN